MTSPYFTPEELAAKVAADRADQGLPPKIEDPAVLARIAALIKATTPAAAPTEESAA